MTIFQSMFYKENNVEMYLINTPQAVYLGSQKTTVAVNKSRAFKGPGLN